MALKMTPSKSLIAELNRRRNKMYLAMLFSQIETSQKILSEKEAKNLLSMSENEAIEATKEEAASENPKNFDLMESFSGNFQAIAFNNILPEILPPEIKSLGHIQYAGLLAYFTIYESDAFASDPYIKNIQLPESYHSASLTLEQHVYHPCELFAYDIPSMVLDGLPLPKLAIFKEVFPFPILFQNDKPWMSISPNEINTMEKPIKEAHGRVLTLGCGLGYFAYMAALKDSVESLTIIERDPEIIEFFKTVIFPQFGPVASKISIIQDDAFSYMETLEDGVFDYCFADLWKSNVDYEPYLKIKNICRKFKKTQCSYWVEDAILLALTQPILAGLLRKLSQVLGDEEPGLSPEDKKLSDDSLAFTKQIFRHENLQSEKDISRCFDSRYIKKQIEKGNLANI